MPAFPLNGELPWEPEVEASGWCSRSRALRAASAGRGVRPSTAASGTASGLPAAQLLPLRNPSASEWSNTAAATLSLPPVESSHLSGCNANSGYKVSLQEALGLIQ